jgi:hypothetical protein
LSAEIITERDGNASSVSSKKSARQVFIGTSPQVQAGWGVVDVVDQRSEIIPQTARTWRTRI